MSERLTPEEIVLVQPTTMDGKWMVLILNTVPPMIVAKFYDREEADGLAAGIRKSLAVVFAERDAAVRERDLLAMTFDTIRHDHLGFELYLPDGRKLTRFTKYDHTFRWTFTGDTKEHGWPSAVMAIRAAMNNTTT